MNCKFRWKFGKLYFCEVSAHCQCSVTKYHSLASSICEIYVTCYPLAHNLESKFKILWEPGPLIYFCLRVCPGSCHAFPVLEAGDGHVPFDDATFASLVHIIPSFVRTIKGESGSRLLGFGLGLGSRRLLASGSGRVSLYSSLGFSLTLMTYSYTLWVSIIFYVICSL